MIALSLAVVGAAYPNKDGSNRQFEIMLCTPGEGVELIPEPKNPADPQAVGVISPRGIQIGYLSAERAPLVRGWLMAGREVSAIFQEPAPYGAVIRVALDGADPILPPPSKWKDQPNPSRDHDQIDSDPGFWPDDEPASE